PIRLAIRTPVDVPNLVTRIVLPMFSELDTETLIRRLVNAGKETFDESARDKSEAAVFGEGSRIKVQRLRKHARLPRTVFHRGGEDGPENLARVTSYLRSDAADECALAAPALLVFLVNRVTHWTNHRPTGVRHIQVTALGARYRAQGYARFARA